MASSTSPDAPAPAPSDVVTCPGCKAKASGKFCSNCGATLVAANCAACGATLSPGAKFCHRCGTPAGADAPVTQNSFASGLPWAVAGIALVAFIALVAGQRFGRAPQAAPGSGQAAAPFANGSGGGVRPPDISNFTPADAAARLYDRVMSAHERGLADSVAFFSPMAIQAYEMIGQLNLDQRYDLGRLGAVSGDQELAAAEADTILTQNPTHLLGLILAGNVARMRKDVAAERDFYDKLKAAAPAEQAKQLPEYAEHENDIKAALDAKRP
jgi:hypothetical protein